MTTLEKLKEIKYRRSSSLVRFMIDAEKLISNSKPKTNQKFREIFANGSMILTIESILGNVTLDQIDELFNFIEKNFGIKYTYKI